MGYTREEVYKASLEYFDGDELQASVFVDKYALRDNDGVFYELTPAQMHDRLAAEFARIEKKYPNPVSEERIRAFLDRFLQGVPQGSAMFGIGNPYQLVSLSNCSALPSPKDTMSSIIERARDMANLFKRRLGVGIDLSTLRPDGSAVNNAAMTSTGAWSFGELYSFIAQMVGQSGRRGAALEALDVRHPDIEKFIGMKSDTSRVTGANISVKLSDDFMRAVDEDKDWELRWPIDAEEPKVRRVVRARTLFELIARNAWATGEPGVLFWDFIRRSLPLDYYPGFDTVVPNPCGELPLPGYDSCRLFSIYMASFVKNPFTPQAYFDMHAWVEACMLAQRLSDDLVDLEIEKLEALAAKADTDDEKLMFLKFAEKARLGRRTGLGSHGLADTLARLRLRYDSDEGIAMTEEIMKAKAFAAYMASVELAKERGAFPLWDWETEKGCEFFGILPNYLLNEMKRVGRRNGALLTQAPAGSISIMSENCSSGIEPVFRNSYTRRRKINRATDTIPEGSVITKDANGNEWIEYTVMHKNVQKYLDTIDTPTNELPMYFVTADQVDWQTRLRMQGVIQRYVDHSISNTVNLSSDATVETVENIYLLAWKLGCKGVTVYRDGSRPNQVLSSSEQPKAEALPKPEAKSRFTSRPRRTHGLMTKAKFTDSSGRSRKVYCYLGKNKADETVEVFLVDEFGGREVHAYASALARLISLALKWRVPPQAIAKRLIGLQGDSQSFSGGHYESVPDFLGKLLLEENKAKTEPVTANTEPIVELREGAGSNVCPNCGSTLRKTEMCEKCDACGWSKC